MQSSGAKGSLLATSTTNGQKDIGAGYVWYEAPNWEMHSMVDQPPEYQPKGYANSFVNHAADLNGDGWVDHMVSISQEHQHGGCKIRARKVEIGRRTASRRFQQREPQYIDIDGDSEPEWVMEFLQIRNNPMVRRGTWHS